MQFPPTPPSKSRSQIDPARMDAIKELIAGRVTCPVLPMTEFRDYMLLKVRLPAETASRDGLLSGMIADEISRRCPSGVSDITASAAVADPKNFMLYYPLKAVVEHRYEED